MATQLHAAQSSIKIAEGSACMGDDKSRKQTETLAMADAKRNAIESVQTYMSSATEVKDFELQKDLVQETFWSGPIFASWRLTGI